MRIDERSGGRRIVGVVAVLLGAGATVMGVLWLAPRALRRNWDRPGRNNTMQRALKWYNRIRLKRAGSERSATAILTHVGRRSGRTYQTPVGAYTYGDGFVLTLIYRGGQTDWYRNVMAAGSCTLTWKGHTYALERPQLIAGPEVIQKTWPAHQRIVLRLVGVRDFLWLRLPQEQSGLSSQIELPTND
ncbi:nitroreductase family deazaflavin-dependent oxidoreductase [Mycolicibacterium sp. Dal123E01]|uniref:nitroreductase family deazaflavin-dependent oxidoreductase n=1 Tax=Mycolicibacterium sp. Dal123E01 TaxID=3457578 RepID=UPI00403E5B87